MTSKYTGLTADTAKHLQLDAGCFIRNFDLSKTYDQQKGNIIGATAGGGSFAAVPTIRQIDVDGKGGPVKGFDAMDEWAVTLTATVKEITANSLKLALATGRSETSTSPTGYTHITAAGEIEASDYADNIAWVGRLSGAGTPIIIVIHNAIATNGLNMTFADKSEATIQVTLSGRYSLDALDKPPFDIYYPDVA